MKQKIKMKKYYKIQFQLISPLNIGSGKNEYTDNDILKDRNGIPYIPGSALAGVIGEYLQKVLKQSINTLSLEKEEKDLLSQEIWNRYYGNILSYDEIRQKDSKKSLSKRMIDYISQEKTDKRTAELIQRYIKNINNDKNFYESRLVFYDAKMLEADKNNYHISKRDCVALDEWKTSIKGAKFDLEILEPGVSFITFVEQNIYDDDVLIADKIAEAWLNQSIRIGAKTMRGFGEIKPLKVQAKEFHFENSNEVKQWLNFDMYNCYEWENFVSSSLKNITRKNILLHLKLRDGISIRKYTTCVNDTKDINSDPDYEQLTVHRKEESIPVIPGTTWAGAFRSHIKKLIPNYDDTYFGFIDNKTKEKKRSEICFSESQIYDAKPKILTRNSVDRFSGATIDMALFTEKNYYGGETDLKISFYSEFPKELVHALAASIADLHFGFLSIGGLTSIGRGLFEVTKVNNIEIKNENEIYQIVLEELNNLNFETKEEENVNL